MQRGRILELVPHEPIDDPRIRWVTELCAGIAATDVIAAVTSGERERREYDGHVYVERIDPNELSSTRARGLAAGLERLVPRRRGGARVIVGLGYASLIANALTRRARALSRAPTVIVCHDLAALRAGVALKERFGSRLVYDAHEYWPEAALFPSAWEKRLVAALERRLARRADLVVTVSPPLAAHLARRYGLRRVLAVPNAEPFRPDLRPASERPLATPPRFLLQGRVERGRGVSGLLEAWRGVDAGRARLAIRAPESEYLTALRQRFRDLGERGALEFLPPVEPGRLVEGASEADVGLIPYGGDSLNHRLACPNKLGQYMHAGLAVLANHGEFVAEVLRRYDCGVTYLDDPTALRAAVETLIAAPDRLEALKRNAYEAARTEFNWEVQSAPYREALEALHLEAA